MVRGSREREAVRREESGLLPGGHASRGISHEQHEPVANAERPDDPCGASRDSDEPCQGPLAVPPLHSRLFFDPYVQRQAWPGLTAEERSRWVDALLERLFAKLDGDLPP